MGWQLAQGYDPGAGSQWKLSKGLVIVRLQGLSIVCTFADLGCVEPEFLHNIAQLSLKRKSIDNRLIINAFVQSG